MKATQTQVTIVLGVVALGALYFVGRKALAPAAAAGEALAYGVQQITPWNHDNVFASSVNKAGAQVFTAPDAPGKNADGSWSLGGFVFDVQQSGVSLLGLLTPAGAAAEGVKAAGREVGGAIKRIYTTPPVAVPSDWNQQTQYDALGNAVGGQIQ